MKRIPSHLGKLALVTVAALAVTTVLAQGPPAGRHGHFRGPGPDGAMHQRMLEHLDLTDDQRDQIEQLMTDHRTAMRERLEQMQALRSELMDRIHSEDFDEAAIRDAATAAAEAHADIAVEQARLRQQIRVLLTPEQREKADEMFRRHREFMEEGGRGPGGERSFHHRRHQGGHQQDLDD